MLASSRQLLRFDSFTIDPVRGTVRRGDAELVLRRQSFEVLQYLAERAHQVVSSEDLTSAIWTARPADHHASVSQCIREIRRAMGDDARWTIRTVSGRGYEFMADVVRFALPESSVSDPPSVAGLVRTPEPAATPANLDEVEPVSAGVSLRPRWRQILPPAVALVAALIAGCWMFWPRSQESPLDGGLTMMAAPTLAVLPFNVVEQGSENAAFLATLAEQITTELVRASRGYDLVVRSSPAINGPLKPAVDGARSGTRYLVNGTTWLDGGTIRINVQLIETASTRQVWGAMFESRSAPPNGINRLAATVARELTVHVRAVEITRPLPQVPEAGHFVLQGRALLESERDEKRLIEAQALFETALKLDPNNIHALQGYARTRINRSSSLPPEQRPAALDQAKVAIERIIAQDNRMPAAHLLHGVLLMLRGDIDNATAALEFALSINPNYRSAHFELGRAKILAGRADEALKHFEIAVQLNPTDPDVLGSYYWAGVAALYLGDPHTAVNWLLKAIHANRKFHDSVRLLAVAYLGVGDEDNARRAMADFLVVSPKYSIAKWKYRALPAKPIVIEQRKSIEEAMRRLGVPEGKSETAHN
jgi:DNA-binding winged helix-turn-helix (wHTH) protein/tetratricopeptide (TPR) repeat protein/TolB-like protein